jgi:undecaprenyl-diphosphatase
VTDYLLSILFGVVEGLTEFLPVSSTAHIRITQFLCGISPRDEFWKMFAVVIQLGAIFAVVVYFRERLLKFMRTFPKGERGNRTWLTHPLTLVLIAFVVTAGPAYLLKKMVEKNLESAWVMGSSLIIGGIIMWIVDTVFIRPRITHVEEMGVLDAAWIGAIQIFSAIFPGTSRSMSTIAAGQTFGMSRQAALEFSFFLSIPIMFAAVGKDLKDYIRPAADPVTHVRPEVVHLAGQQWGILIVGLIVSFIVAWGVIAWFMNWVRTKGFVPFAIYRIIAGAAVLALAYGGKL